MKSQRSIILLPLILASLWLNAQIVGVPEVPGRSLNLAGASPAILEGDTLFYFIHSFGPFTPEERAKGLADRLENLLNQPDFDPDSIVPVDMGQEFYIAYKDQILTVVGPGDTLYPGENTRETASRLATLLQTRMSEARNQFNSHRILSNFGYTALILVVLILIIWLLTLLFRYLFKWLEGRKDRIFRGIKLNNYEFLPVDREYAIAVFVMKLLKVLLIITLFLVALPLIFSIFPATEGITRKVVGMVWSPVRGILLAVVNYLPKLVTILIIYFIFRYIIKFFRFLSREIENKVLVLPGFHPDWAKSTFNIIRVLLYAFMFVMIFPYLPGSGSPVFQGVSVFLGVLLSLGSTSLISNSIAGLVITYMRPFKVGDRIKLDDIVGTVMEKSMMTTRIRTTKNEDITIPNSKILTSHTINYTTPTEESDGLIIYTTVTIGYDAPWRTVHKLLQDAAADTPEVMKKPAPFVLQTSLDDFYVSYQVNAYIKNALHLPGIMSDLHQNIQDRFNRAGVEIMSPHYRAERDGNEVTIPKNPESVVPAEKETPLEKKKSKKE